jgi:hypothetical protein
MRPAILITDKEDRRTMLKNQNHALNLPGIPRETPQMTSLCKTGPKTRQNPTIRNLDLHSVATANKPNKGLTTALLSKSLALFRNFTFFRIRLPEFTTPSAIFLTPGKKRKDRVNEGHDEDEQARHRPSGSSIPAELKWLYSGLPHPSRWLHRQYARQ